MTVDEAFDAMVSQSPVRLRDVPVAGRIVELEHGKRPPGELFANGGRDDSGGGSSTVLASVRWDSTLSSHPIDDLELIR